MKSDIFKYFLENTKENHASYLYFFIYSVINTVNEFILGVSGLSEKLLTLINADVRTFLI